MGGKVTERIKEALKKAREQRQQTGVGVTNDVNNELAADAGSRLGTDRILAREPFRQYSESEQSRLLEAARVLDINGGDTFQFAGDRDAYVHYLLSGAVVLEGDNESTPVSADMSAAEQPLDHAGIKTHSITATVDSEVLRVPGHSVPGRRGADEGASAIPTSEYTETFSGQQLAELVEEINAEHATLNEPQSAAADPHRPRDVKEQEPFFELSTSADDVDSVFDFPGDESLLIDDQGSYVPKVDDEIGAFARELESRFRRYVDKVKADERARYEARLQAHSVQLQALAEQQLATRVNALRERYQDAHAEKDRRLRERYRNLRDFANKIARQKAAIYVARRQISEKLRMVEQIHTELSQLGSQLNNQLDDLDDLMPTAATAGGDS